MKPTHLKFCGIQTLEEIEWLNALEGTRPTYIGFVLAPSKRQVGYLVLSELIAALSKDYIPVGVYVNPSLEEIQNGINAGLQVIQLHGDESLERVKEITTEIDLNASQNSNTDFTQIHTGSIQIWKAIRVGRDLQTDLEEIDTWLESGVIDYVLLDLWKETVYGGTGESFDWAILSKITNLEQVFVAGGLTAEKLENLSRLRQLAGVDVSSGIEVLGRKNLGKMHSFLKSFEHAMLVL